MFKVDKFCKTMHKSEHNDIIQGVSELVVNTSGGDIRANVEHELA